MTDRTLRIAFHIGAHKTATSHLQRSLMRARDALGAQGVQYYGPDHFRLPGNSIQALFAFQPGVEADKPIRPANTQLAMLQKDGHRIVLSEENFIGPLNQPHGRGMRHRYKAAGDRLTELSTAVGQDVDVFLAVRRPTAFINSAYCQMLLGGRVQPVAVFQRRNPLSSVDWVDLVTRLRAAPGVGTLTVWKYEDYGAVFPQIIAGLVGAEAADCVAPRPRRINRGLSTAAVAQVLADEGGATAPKVAQAARQMFPIEDGHDPFDGFAPEEHAIGDAAYARQLASIAAMQGVTLLCRPSP
ncbi:hypothetical protein [Roseobacter sp. CCS2]|uniref:hypothetical protein n=1 Tax=Roseobacter sp. CCS2 TaxID=391593 RepID=UPI00056A1851|nr:hypothetical protein [Roseobacter sp. CCS2]